MDPNPTASILTERREEAETGVIQRELYIFPGYTGRPGLYSRKCKNAWGYRELAEASKG